MTNIKELKQEFYDLTGIETKFDDVLLYADKYGLVNELMATEGAKLTARHKQFWINAVNIAMREIQESEADLAQVKDNDVNPTYSGYDYCKLEDRELNQILDDGTLLDNLHSRAFPPKGENYSVIGVVESLNAAGYQTTNDKDSVTIFDVEGWISVYPDRLFFNFDGDYDMKIAASLGIDISNKPWNREDKPKLGAFRYSVWVFNEAKREYGFEDSFVSLKLAQTFIREELHKTDKIDLRKELYLDGRWQCQKHIELVST